MKRHSRDLTPNTTCRCRDPLCAGTDETGRLLPRRTLKFVVEHPSGTFRSSAIPKLERMARKLARSRTNPNPALLRELTDALDCLRVRRDG